MGFNTLKGDLMKRIEAAQLGLKTYNSGKPCNRNHTTDRYTSSGMCIGCLNHHSDAMREARTKVNTAHVEGLRSYPVFIKPQYNTTVSDYCNILRYGSPELIEQCTAFITMMQSTIK